jgi:hypothetical protein
MKKLFIASLFIFLTSCAANSTTNTDSSANPETKQMESAEVKMPTAAKEDPKTPAKTPAKAPSLKDKISSCTCVKIWMPVCGENKKTYGNSCEADCAGVKYTSGACKQTK